MRLDRCLMLTAVALALVLSFSVGRAQLTMVESGYTSTHLADDVSKQVQLGIGPGTGCDTCIYYGSFDGLKRLCAPDDMGTICDSALTFAVGIEWGRGGAWGTGIYVADYGINDIYKSSDCCGEGTLFATVSGPGSIAFPPAGSPFGDYLYACVVFDGPILRVTSAGTTSTWLAREAAYLRFGPGGTWTSDLYVTTDYSAAPNAKIVRITSAGAVTQVVTGMFTPEGFDWGFAGDLFATDATMGQVLRIKPNGDKSVFATVSGAADVAYRPGEKALYVVSNQGGLYRIVANSLVDVPDSPRADLTLVVAPNPARNGCTLRFNAQAAGVTRARIVDAAGRLVRRLAEGWRPAGPQSIAWDGRDDAGALVPAGTYFARVLEAANTRVARVTIAR